MFQKARGKKFSSQPEEEKRLWQPPVGWLLDRELVTSLREIMLYSAFGTRMDPRIWMVGREFNFSRDFSGEEFWFDYLSDSGDGMRATYSIAYLAYSELFVPAGSARGDQAAFEASAATPKSLPRGEFLFVGGDTAYHVADYETLAERFQLPFQWAFNDLKARDKVDRKERRPIFGIPGNHDYYDFLDGFNRQFRKPFGDEHEFDPHRQGDQPQLVLGGFKRRQGASYVSIELPFHWRMWGLDAEGGGMDRRQKHFFSEMVNDPKTETDRLIVATPEPITRFGQRRKADAEIVHTLHDIGLSCPFLDPPEPLPTGGCRLDLSGDVHHYARYWGADATSKAGEGEAGAAGASIPPDPRERPNYASVVSGLGGAFLHPSCTDVGEIPAKVRYPKPPTALAAVLSRVLKPWSIVKGGRVWLIGTLIAALLFLGAVTSACLRNSLEQPLQRIGLALPTLENKQGEEPGKGLVVGALSALRTALQVTRTVDVGKPEPESVLTAGSSLWNRELVYLPVLLILTGLFTGRNHFLAARAKKGESIATVENRWPIWFLAAASVFSIGWIFGHPGESQYGRFYPLASNFVVLAILFLAYLGLLWCRQYDDAMNRRARKKGRLSWVDQAHGWALWAFTLLVGLFGVTRYGVDSLAVVSIDVVSLIAVLGILVGLPAFAATVGGELQGWIGKVGFAALGIWHALLQLIVPLFLVSTLPWRLSFAAGAATVLFSWLVSLLAPRWTAKPDASDRKRLGFILLGLWVAWSVGLITLAYRFASPQRANGASFFVDLGLGLILTCTFFGWYLAVSICFDGHNNEAGGGARIEQFKQFIRFRLTAQGLTGYVIAIDEVEEDGSQLKPRLIDVFEVRPS